MSIAVLSRRMLAALAIAVPLSLGVVACAEQASEVPAGEPDGSTVVLHDSRFSPSTLTVPAGTTVTWQWADGFIPHDVVGSDFKSPKQVRGTFTHTFDTPGTYQYLCSLLSDMTGSIVVTA
jgi:plastocyanin